MKSGKTDIGELKMIEACFCEHCLEIRRQQERLRTIQQDKHNEYQKLLQKEQNPALVTGN